MALVRLLTIAGVLLAAAPVLAQAPPSNTPAPNTPAPAPGPSSPSDPSAIDATPTGVAAPSPPQALPTPPPPVPAAQTQSAEAKRAAEKVAREAAAVACQSQSPDCDWMATLSSLERSSIRRAIEARGYVIEPSPWGKRIGVVNVYNEDVFAEKNRWLQLLNFFHYTTRESTIRKDLVVETGEVYDQQIVDETARHLRDPTFTSVIAIVPVVSKTAGSVDLLVVTRDIWSLRLNTQYTFQQGSLTNLSMAVSENNFLGFRTLVAGTVLMDQGTLALGPLLLDKNFVGKHFEFRAAASTIINRDKFFNGDWANEGSTSSVRVTKTLWRLSEKWGANVAFSHRFAIERSYLGIRPRPVYCPDGAARCQFPTLTQAKSLPEGEVFDYRYRNRSYSTSASTTRQWGHDLKQQIAFGWNYDRLTYAIRANEFSGTPDQLVAFSNTVLPVSENNSVPYVEYSFFQPRYKTRRNVQTYDLAEDLRSGANFDVSYGLGLEAWGSSRNFQRGGITAGYTLGFAQDASATLSGSYATRYQDGEFRDNTASSNVRVVTPSFGGHGRFVAEASFATRWDDRVTRFYFIGSDNGLRGYDINEFFGKRLASTQIEYRTTPIPIWVFRAGGVVFGEAGAAADTVGEMKIRPDAGFGVRALVPQTSRELFRFDLAFPLDGRSPTPHFIAGFQSDF
ncbi:hypothetical protein BH11MYX2_BH11MYX2_40460 [soil metagenome]